LSIRRTLSISPKTEDFSEKNLVQAFFRTKAKIAEYPVDPHGRPFSLDIPPNPSPSTKCDKKVLQNE